MEMFLFNIVFFMIVSVFNGSVRGSEVETRHDNFVQGLNNKLSKHGLITNTTTRSKLQCADFCLSSEKCVSFFYIKNKKQCYLHNCVLRASSFGLYDQDGSKYYRKNKPVTCPTDRGYTHDISKNLCYKVECNVVDNYRVALDSCTSDCGHLAMVGNQQMQDYYGNTLVTFCPGYNGERVFIDGSNLGAGGQWAFYNGEVFTWTNWKPNQPNNNQDYNSDGEHYLDMGLDGSVFKWNDVDDSEWPGRFICQIELEF